MNRLKSKSSRRIIQGVLIIALICLLNPYSIVKEKYLVLYEQSVEDLGESYVWQNAGFYLCLASEEDQLKVIEMIKRSRPILTTTLPASNRTILLGKNELGITWNVISFPEHDMLLFRLQSKDAAEINRMFNELPVSEQAPWYNHLVNYEYPPVIYSRKGEK